jgi:hypothetical protein
LGVRKSGFLDNAAEEFAVVESGVLDSGGADFHKAENTVSDCAVAKLYVAEGAVLDDRRGCVHHDEWDNEVGCDVEVGCFERKTRLL